MEKIESKQIPQTSGVYPVRGRGSFRNVSVRLRVELKKLPTSNGVYFFRDKRGRILYIGKAVNLRARVGSYFNKQSKDSRISKMLRLAGRVTWQEKGSEIEALIFESQLIKKHQPQFNVMFRDDKRYFYVGFTEEKFPRVFLTHQPHKSNQESRIKNQEVEPNSLFVGPFTDGGALKTTLRLLRRLFPYCTCKQKLNNYCLNYHINKCSGFCCLKNNPEHSRRTAENIHKYRKNIRAIRDVLSGKRADLIKKLKREMMILGAQHKFEQAIELRDKIEKLEKVFENAQIIHNSLFLTHSSENGEKNREALKGLAKLLKLKRTPERVEGYDISNIQGKFAVGVTIVFIGDRPDKSQYRKFKIKLGDRPNDVAMLREVLTRRFNHPEWQYPDLIIIDGGKGQLNAAKAALSGSKIKNYELRVIALTKDERHRGSHIYISGRTNPIQLKKLRVEVRNLILQIDAEAHRFAISYYRQLHKRKTIS